MDLRERPQGAFLRHPWETSRCRFFSRVLVRGLRQLQPAAEPVRILDAGAGDGWLASQALSVCPPGTRIHCWDEGYNAAELAALGAAALDGVTFHREPPEGLYDVLLLLDVLEHVGDDRSFLRELVKTRLAQDGIAIVSVPAWPALFSQHDHDLGHHRRYRPKALHALLSECGLGILESGGLFHSLVLLRMAEGIADRLRGGGPGEGPSHEWPGGPSSARIAEALLAFDTGISQLCARFGLGVPGLSCWAVCKKSG
jgi:2-polyprenyl-3-methyl-5-hydroxy-6-metoxy-1,4-benzoquinol methylase